MTTSNLLSFSCRRVTLLLQTKINNSIILTALFTCLLQCVLWPSINRQIRQWASLSVYKRKKMTREFQLVYRLRTLKVIEWRLIHPDSLLQNVLAVHIWMKPLSWNQYIFISAGLLNQEHCHLKYRSIKTIIVYMEQRIMGILYWHKKLSKAFSME